ncbi:MAG: YihY/virulence factor BrkB family protein [Cyclobacteriaceae bacterium]
MSKVKNLFLETWKGWIAGSPFRQGAIIGYFTIFSLPALIIISINMAGLLYSQKEIQSRVQEQVEYALGSDAAQQIQIIYDNTDLGDSWHGILIGVGTLIFGGTGVFYHLQQSLNKIWEVEASQDKGIKRLVLDRAISLGLILVIGLLLIVLILANAFLNFLEEWLRTQISVNIYQLIYAGNILVSLLVISLLIAVIFKFLPDVEIGWNSVWIGSFVTAILFITGQFLLGLYFKNFDPTSSYGLAGSIILLMLWANYSAMILLFGAQFTQVWARYKGKNIVPSEHAKRTPRWILEQREP